MAFAESTVATGYNHSWTHEGHRERERERARERENERSCSGASFQCNACFNCSKRPAQIRGCLCDSRYSKPEHLLIKSINGTCIGPQSVSTVPTWGLRVFQLQQKYSNTLSNLHGPNPKPYKP